MRYLVNPTTGELKEENAAVSLDIIAPEEETAVASRAYAEGEQFILAGKLYAATAAIASGASIVTEGAGANAEEAPNVINQIENMSQADLSNVTGTLSIDHGGTGATSAAAARTNLGVLPLSGGAMTGSITMSGTTYISYANSGTTTRNLIYATMGDNDQFRLAAGATAANAGWVEIATADDATEPIYVRQYTGVFTTIKRTLTLLDGSGNTSIPGSLTLGSALTLANGGTGATSAAAARTNLGLSTVASSGSYNDLSNKPTIPVKTSQLTNDSGFITQDTTKLPLSGGTITGSLTVNQAFVQGAGSVASGALSHAQGSHTTASAAYSHAQGEFTLASRFNSHAEGYKTTASNEESHAEGYGTLASGNYSHAEGYGTLASTFSSHAQGSHTTADGYNQLACGRYNVVYSSSSGTSGALLIVGKGSDSSAKANCFRVTTANIYATAAYSSSGADYAEMFEWEDGNPDKEDRAGLFVIISDDKIKIANSSDDFILGIVSGNPSCVGDVYDDQWNGMFETDIFGRPVYETYFDEDTLKYETREKLNPNYDPSQEYIARSARPEWDAVGLVGKLIAIDDGTAVVNGWVKPNDAGIATASATLTKFRVMKRLDETHIQVLIL